MLRTTRARGFLTPLLAVVSTLLVTQVTPAAAEEAADRAAAGSDLTLTLGAGAFFTPDYLGSDEYEVRPFPFLRVQKETFYLETDGPGVRANVMPHDLFEFGPIIRYGEGRDDVDDDVVDRLPEIDDELWIGLFAGFGDTGVFHDRDSWGLTLEAVEAVTGDNGLTASLSVDYGRQATDDLSLSISGSATYADSQYADTYFSISSAAASASGLSAYSAGSGLRDVGVTLTGRYRMTESVGVGTVLGVSRLLGDFADSPIVDDRGSATQGFGGVFLTYRF